MKDMITKLSALLTMLFISSAVFAQTTLEGRVSDGNDPIAGVSVSIKGTTTGTSTDASGQFSLTSQQSKGTLVLRMLGFATKEISFNGSADLGEIVLPAADGQELGEVMIVGRGVIDIAEDRKTPIAVSTLSTKEIQDKGVGNVEFPEIMKNVPSVYIASQSGGYGDGQMYVRGFDQSNTAFLINGQPVNGMEDGNLYWSNWSGMADVANIVQIQRGLGSSKLAISSVGGTVNIVTKATELKKGGFVRLMGGDSGYGKASIAYNTGMMGKWGVSFMLDGWRGDTKGGILGTGGAGQSYFVSVGFKPNSSHNFNFMIFGAPQWHNQNRSRALETAYRGDMISNPGYDLTGRKGNSWYGWYKGEGLSQITNYYHKPVSNLNWDWTINDKSSLSTVLYASVGRGGGTGLLGNGPGYTEDGYSSVNGTTNWDALAALNAQQPGGISIGNNGTVLRASVNNHAWYGLVSNYMFDTKENWTFNAGIDLRMYSGDHYQQLVNLLGANGRQAGSADLEGNVNRPADYVVSATFNTNPWSALFNSASKEERLGYDYKEFINYQGVFGQAEYSKDGFTAFLQGALSNQSYKKRDDWGYKPEENTSDTETKLGYNIKGGVSYTVEDTHTFFANAGLYSRQPFSDNIFEYNKLGFADPEVDNEKVLGLELGYRFTSDVFDVNVNAYYTKWDNRFTGYSVDDQVIDGKQYDHVSYLLTSIGQLHKGLELDFNWRALSNLSIRGFASVGDWKFDGSSPYRVRDNDTYNIVFEDTKGVELTGTKVGDAAQTMFGLGVQYDILPQLSVDANFNNYSNLYATTVVNDVIAASLSGETYQPEKLDSYNILDAGISYTFQLNRGNTLKLRGNVRNILDEKYFARKDGYGYIYGLGRTWNAGLTYSF